MKRWDRFSAVFFTIITFFCTTADSLTFQGTVTDTLGKAVFGASVTFTDEANPVNSMSTVTDDIYGKYQIGISTSVNDNTNVLPKPFDLDQNYPNPFNPSTAIPFTLSHAGETRLIIYNVLGQNIRTLVNGYLSTGAHSIIWDGRDDNRVGVGAGVYIYMLSFGKETITRKMLLMDGNNTSASTFSQGISSSDARLLKPATVTFKVNIVAADIEPFEKTGITLINGETYDFIVNRIQIIPEVVTFVSIPGGTFQMGDVENVGYESEKPVHTVTVSDFEMSEAEITNAQYCAYLNAALVTDDITVKSSSVTGKKGTYSGQEYINLGGFSDYPDARCYIKLAGGTFTVETGRENYPVIFVTWYGSKAFAEYYVWDLPTETEWEYACRGGKQYLYGTDDGTISKDKANYYQNGPHHPVSIKSYPKNPFGLYDMSGNVWEWCSDWYGNYSSSPVTNHTGAQTGSYRINRGGSWGSDDNNCRSAFRGSHYPYGRGSPMGFRVVRR